MSYDADDNDENPYDEFTPITPHLNGPEQSAENNNDNNELPPPTDSGVSLWDDPANLEALKMEREVHPDESPEDLVRRFLREAVPNVTQGLIKLALSASNENTKLNAQKVVLDMVLREGDAQSKASWEDFVADAVSTAELHANTGSSS